MATKKKRFQSGNEIFKEYIPNYEEEGERGAGDERPFPADAGSKLACALLGEFKAQLDRKI